MQKVLSKLDLYINGYVSVWNSRGFFFAENSSSWQEQATCHDLGLRWFFKLKPSDPRSMPCVASRFKTTRYVLRRSIKWWSMTIERRRGLGFGWWWWLLTGENGDDSDASGSHWCAHSCMSSPLGSSRRRYPPTRGSIPPLGIEDGILRWRVCSIRVVAA